MPRLIILERQTINKGLQFTKMLCYNVTARWAGFNIVA